MALGRWGWVGRTQREIDGKKEQMNEVQGKGRQKVEGTAATVM